MDAQHHPSLVAGSVVLGKKVKLFETPSLHQLRNGYNTCLVKL